MGREFGESRRRYLSQVLLIEKITSREGHRSTCAELHHQPRYGLRLPIERDPPASIKEELSLTPDRARRSRSVRLEIQKPRVCIRYAHIFVSVRPHIPEANLWFPHHSANGKFEDDAACGIVKTHHRGVLTRSGPRPSTSTSYLTGWMMLRAPRGSRQHAVDATFCTFCGVWRTTRTLRQAWVASVGARR